MNNTLTGLLFGVGVGGWIYYQMMRRSGGQAKIAWGMAFAGGAIGAFVVYSLLGMLFPD
jgi:hypothetical protein